MSAELESTYRRIYRCIAKIPAGKVATYGQIANLVDASGARQIGYALSATPDDIDIPWHRVINAKGEVSQRAGGGGDSVQSQRLLGEGVIANKQGRISLALYRWQPSFEDLIDEGDEAVDDEQWLDQPGFG